MESPFLSALDKLRQEDLYDNGPDHGWLPSFRLVYGTYRHIHGAWHKGEKVGESLVGEGEGSYYTAKKKLIRDAFMFEMPSHEWKEHAGVKRTFTHTETFFLPHLTTAFLEREMGYNRGMPDSGEIKKLVPNSGGFKIKTEIFEGPLDLLLSLVEKRKLFINDIALAKVTDDFISHIQQFEKLPMGESAQFILVASTLLLIKSRSLLPSLTLTEDEQTDIHDLEIRLKIYKKIKDASSHIKALFGHEVIFQPAQSRPVKPVFSPHESMNLLNLAHAIKSVIQSLPKKEHIPKAMVRKVVSLEEMIDNLTKRITAGLRMSFKEFAGEHKHERVNVIVSFLAMLELVKQGTIHVSQNDTFGDIHMETKNVGVPRYDML